LPATQATGGLHLVHQRGTQAGDIHNIVAIH